MSEYDDKGGWGDDDWNEGDIAAYRNAISPICSECGSPLETKHELEYGLCEVCWEWLHR